jgi:multidrug efflux pump subunit AcrA (membrane-fusion protein)
MRISLTSLTALLSAPVATIKRLWHTHPRYVVVVAVLIAIGVVALLFVRGGNAPTEIVAQPHRVSLIAAASYAQKGSTKGTSASTHESVLRAEVGGMVTQVAPVGSRVSAGQVVAQLDNDAQRAALLQYEGALDSAKASQQKVLEGTRTEQRVILQSTFDAAKKSAVSSLLSAYSSVDSAVRDAADQVFNSPSTGTPTLVFNTTNSNRESYLINTRVSLGPVLSRQKTASGEISVASDLTAEFARTQEDVRLAYQLIDTLVASLNDAIPTIEVTAAEISAYKADAIAARTSLTTALSSLTTAQNNLVDAQKKLEQSDNGAQGVDISSAAASVKQSQGAYASAVAAYDKTLIRARTAGTVVRCSAKVGDVIGVGDDVCRVTSSGSDLGTSFALPLSAVKYTPVGAYVFVLDEGAVRAVPVESGLVTAERVVVYGLSGDEMIVQDIRGIKEGDVVTVE